MVIETFAIRRLFPLLVGITLALLPLQALDATERVNAGDENVAILGYDPVAYFTVGEAVPGLPEIEHRWRDAIWHFSTNENRDLFAGDPEQYAPRYGGFCAGAMSRGFRASIDPEAWTIVDGRLYLLYAQQLVEDFEGEAEDRIPLADENWLELGQAE